MKLKYQIEKTTELSSSAIIDKLLFIIKREKYRVVNVTDSQILFDNKRQLSSSWEYASRVRSGTFEIIPTENGNTIVFEYYPIPVSDFTWVGIICVVCLIFGILNNFYAPCFLPLLFIGQLIFKHFNLKYKAEEILTEATV